MITIYREFKRQPEDASAKALQAGAEADIETKKVETTLATLQKSLQDTDQRKDQLENSITDLNAAEKRMVTATADLEQKEKALKRIIESENLATTFAELRNDHYRVRTLRARALYELSEVPASTIQFTLNTISLSRELTNKNPSQENVVVQFYQVGMPLGLNNASGSPIGALVTFEMYPLFEQVIASHSLTNLDGLTRLSLQFGPTGSSPALTTDAAVNNLEELIKDTKKLTIEIEVNGTVLARHEFTKNELLLPADRSSLLSNGFVTFNVTKDISNSYKDVKTLFDSLTAGQ